MSGSKCLIIVVQALTISSLSARNFFFLLLVVRVFAAEKKVQGGEHQIIEMFASVIFLGMVPRAIKKTPLTPLV